MEYWVPFKFRSSRIPNSAAYESVLLVSGCHAVASKRLRLVHIVEDVVYTKGWDNHDPQFLLKLVCQRTSRMSTSARLTLRTSFLSSSSSSFIATCRINS